MQILGIEGDDVGIIISVKEARLLSFLLGSVANERDATRQLADNMYFTLEDCPILNWDNDYKLPNESEELIHIYPR